MQKLVLPIVACLIAIAATGASAQSVWKWRDASGQVHISDAPPPANVPDKNILQRPSGAPAPAMAPTPAGEGSTSAATASAGATASAAATGVDSELQKKKARADKEKAEKDAADKAALDKKNAAIRADNCQRAQGQVKAFESGVRIARTNANGEREFLDDKQRASELQRAQESAAQNCK
jgi:hypothetical protein